MIGFKKTVTASAEPIVTSHDLQAELLFVKNIERLHGQLQGINDAFNLLEVGSLKSSDLLELVTFPERVYSRYKSLIVDELVKTEEIRAGRKLNRGYVESSIYLPSPAALIHTIDSLGAGKTSFIKNPELFELIKDTVHLNASLLKELRSNNFRTVITDPAKIALWHLMHQYADMTNELSKAFAKVYPDRPAFVQVVEGTPFEIRTFQCLKADFAAGKVVPRLTELK